MFNFKTALRTATSKLWLFTIKTEINLCIFAQRIFPGGSRNLLDEFSIAKELAMNIFFASICSAATLKFQVSIVYKMSSELIVVLEIVFVLKTQNFNKKKDFDAHDARSRVI